MRYIGISLNDDYTGICVNEEGQLTSIPTVVCKEKNKDHWLIGEAAYKSTLTGSGVIVDKLLSLLRKDGTATIEKVRYSAVRLLGFFLKELLQDCGEDLIVVSIRKPELRMMHLIREALLSAGAAEDKIYIISHTESFVHFVLKQDKNLYNRLVGMFELSNQCLYYYEMRVSKGARQYVMADSEAQEEAFNLDILKTASGGKIADKILCSLAERVLAKKSYSSVFLSGKGFENTAYAANFMNILCNRRRVCIEPDMFAIGAMIYADQVGRKEPEEYTILCDTRVGCDVSVRVQVHEKEENLPIVTAGSSWVNMRSSYEMILDNQNYIDFAVAPMIGFNRRPIRMRMLLDGFPERENRTTRIQMTTEFADSRRLRVIVRDKGFGELFPAQGMTLTEEIDLTKAMEKKD